MPRKRGPGATYWILEMREWGLAMECFVIKLSPYAIGIYIPSAARSIFRPGDKVRVIIEKLEEKKGEGKE